MPGESRRDDTENSPESEDTEDGTETALLATLDLLAGSTSGRILQALVNTGHPAD